jgi:hypothetical protein
MISLLNYEDPHRRHFDTSRGSFHIKQAPEGVRIFGMRQVRQGPQTAGTVPWQRRQTSCNCRQLSEYEDMW